MNRRYLLCLLMFVAGSVAAGAGVRVDSMLTMSDGARLSVSWMAPTTPVPTGGHPAVVMIHSFEAYQDAKLQYFSDAGPAQIYADSGYFSFTFSVRGQGVGAVASDGDFTWFTGDREMEDLREILSWLDARPDVKGSRIAIEGLSQGGFMAWGAATKGLPVRCIVPNIANAKFTKTFLGNGGYNYLGLSLFIAAKMGEGSLIRIAPFFADSLYSAFIDDRYGNVVELLKRVEIEQDIPKVTAAVFIQGAWQDDINPSQEVLRTFVALRSPRKLLLWPGGHHLPDTKAAAIRLVETLRFYRYWLKDDTAGNVMSPAEAITLIDAATGIRHTLSTGDSVRILPLDHRIAPSFRFYLHDGGKLSSKAPVAPLEESRLYRRNASDESIIFRTEPLDSAVTFIAGAAHLVTSSNARTWQANLLLWDHDPATGRSTPMMRGGWQVREGGTTRVAVEYDLSSQLHTVAAGHRIEARVKFGTNTATQFLGVPVKPSNEFGLATYPPQESGMTTLHSTADEPSYIELYTFALPAVVSKSRATALSLEIPGNVVLDGRTIIARAGILSGGGIAELFDMEGRRVWMLTLPEVEGVINIAIESAGLAAGRYILRLRQGDAAAEAQILVVH